MRIVWTKEEKNLLFKEMAETVFFQNTGLSNKDALKKAQLFLPFHRRLAITDQRVFNYKHRINEARETARRLHNLKAAEVVAVTSAPAPVQEAPKRSIDNIGQLFELLVDAISDRVMQQVEARFNVEKPKDEASQTPSIQQTGWLDELEKLSIRSKEAKQHKPTVLIIGLNGAQIDAIKTRYDKIEYTFATAEQALSRHTFNCDHTILMTKFINHGVHTKYRKHKNLHYCNGGVSELRTLLHGLFYKEAA